MYHIVSHCVILCYIVSHFHIVSNCVMTKGPFFSRSFSLPWIWIMGNFYRCLGWFWSRAAQYVNSWWKVIPNGYKSKSKHMKFISISLSILKNLYFKHRSWRHLKWNSFLTNCSDPTPKLDHPYNTHMFDAKLIRLVYLERFFFYLIQFIWNFLFKCTLALRFLILTRWYFQFLTFLKTLLIFAWPLKISLSIPENKFRYFFLKTSTYSQNFVLHMAVMESIIPVLPTLQRDPKCPSPLTAFREGCAIWDKFVASLSLHLRRQSLKTYFYLALILLNQQKNLYILW